MASQNNEVEELRKKVQKLEKINKALMKRVENSTASQGNAFSLFEGNLLLREEIHQKTELLDQAKIELEKLRNSLDQAVVIFELDKRGMVLDVNAKFLEVSGYDRNEIVNESLDKLKSGSLGIDFWDSFWEQLKINESFQDELLLKRKDGENLWLESTAFPIFDSNNKLLRYIVIAVDISDKKQSEMQFLHQAKLASIGEMSAGIGHEINNPLAISVGNINAIEKLIQKEEIDVAKALERIGKIKKANERIRKIVDGLRTYARSDSINVEKTSLNFCITSTVDLISEMLNKKGIILKTDLSVDELNVKANVGKLQQVVMNLITNARDATDKQDDRQIIVKSWHEGMKSCVSVSDNGCGIPDEIKDKILNPFFTTKEVGKGTGIGLGVVKEITESFQGELIIESTVGEGSTFTLQFPSYN